jgi:NADH-quinone oxidoreductase subunit C
MEAQHIVERVQQLVPDSIAAPLSSENTKDPFFKVKPDKWLDVARALRDTSDLAFDFCNNITAVDWIKQNILQVVFHLWSYRHRHQIVIKIDLDRAKPQLPSVESVWKAANWNEREQYDLFGVEFLGHPELKRILLPDDWVGHPMRKDYKEATEYRGMPTTRPSVMDLLNVYDKAHVKVEGIK